MGQYNKPSNYAEIRRENEKKYGTDIGRIGKMLLADRYADRTHFIFELLQNTEDALARCLENVGNKPASIKFEIHDNALEIKHYGKLFDEKDVRGICGIAESTKDGKTAIGRFGIGFKSVYAFTENPEIHSGNEHFTIENYVWPNEISAISLDNNETRIILPFFTDKKLDDYNEIVSGLKRINLNSLLFLHHIEEIEWSASNGESGVFIRSKPQILDKNVKKIELIGKLNTDSEINEQWLVFSKEILNKDNNALLEIAFSIKNDRINPILHSPLIVFFPTVLQTYLGFLVQGPYRTTPSRDNIPIKDEWNQYCAAQTGELAVEALEWLKNHNLLNVEALQCFPLNRSNFNEDNMFSQIFNTVKRVFLEKALLPCHQGGYTSVKTALLAGTNEVRELFTTEQLFQLFGNNYFWLSEEISQDKTPELRKYLMNEFNEHNELKTREIHPETILNRINIEFLKKQPNRWICRFYEFLNGQKRLHERIKAMPIIRLSDMSHVTPYHNGKPQVFLPGKETDFPTIHKEVCSTDESYNFLKAINLTETNQIDDVIRNILPKFNMIENNFNENTYKQAIERILLAYRIDSESQKERLINELKTVKFIAAVDAVSDKKYYALPSTVYFPTDNLRRLFSGVQNVYFVNEQYGLREEKYRTLLEACGVARNLRPVKNERAFSYQELELMRKNVGSIDKTWEKLENDNTICGLGELINNLVLLNLDEKKEKSCLLWKELHNLYERRRDSIFIGTYKWGFHHRSHSCYFDTYFIRLLNISEWIPDTNGNLQKPSNIDFKQLGWENHDFLLSKIHFKLDAIQEFEEKTGLKVVPPEKLQKFLLWEQSQKNITIIDTEPRKEFKPSHSAADAPLKIVNYIEKDRAIPFNISQLNNHNMLQSDKDNSSNNSNKKESTNQNDIDENEYFKDIGRWGEEYVLRSLREEFKESNSIEIIDLNENGKLGVGADIVVKEKYGNTIKKLVEVKTTIQARGSKIEISGNQWETARYYFNINNGDLYWIYCVYNADKINPEIVRVQNPLKKWKDGLLVADPVNFIIN